MTRTGAEVKKSEEREGLQISGEYISEIMCFYSCLHFTSGNRTRALQMVSSYRGIFVVLFMFVFDLEKKVFPKIALEKKK